MISQWSFFENQFGVAVRTNNSFRKFFVWFGVSCHFILFLLKIHQKNIKILIFKLSSICFRSSPTFETASTTKKKAQTQKKTQQERKLMIRPLVFLKKATIIIQTIFLTLRIKIMVRGCLLEVPFFWKNSFWICHFFVFFLAFLRNNYQQNEFAGNLKQLFTSNDLISSIFGTFIVIVKILHEVIERWHCGIWDWSRRGESRC